MIRFNLERSCFSDVGPQTASNRTGPATKSSARIVTKRPRHTPERRRRSGPLTTYLPLAARQAAIAAAQLCVPESQSRQLARAGHGSFRSGLAVGVCRRRRPSHRRAGRSQTCRSPLAPRVELHAAAPVKSLNRTPRPLRLGTFERDPCVRTALARKAPTANASLRSGRLKQLVPGGLEDDLARP